MKKERSAFFQNTNSAAVGYINPAPNMYPPNQNMMPYPSNNNGYFEEFDNRLAKIERQLNRLNERLNKLESSTLFSTTDDTNNAMYMI